MKKLIIFGIVMCWVLLSGCATMEHDDPYCKKIADNEWEFNNSNCMRMGDSCCCKEVIEKDNSFKEIDGTSICFDLKMS